MLTFFCLGVRSIDKSSFAGASREMHLVALCRFYDASFMQAQSKSVRKYKEYRNSYDRTKYAGLKYSGEKALNSLCQGTGWTQRRQNGRKC